MRVLFCHDGPLRKDEFNDYYGSAHNDETFQRYYNIADELAVAIRIKGVSKENAVLKFSKLTVSPFEVIHCPNLSSIKGMIFNRRRTKKIIKKEVEKADYIVARLPSTIGYIAIDFAKNLNKPYLVELVTCPWDAFWNHSIKGKIVAPYMYYAAKRYVKEADYVVYVTNEFLQNRYPTKGKGINCSNVALKKFDDAILEKRLTKISNMNKDNKLVIGTTAAVNVRFKGQQYIIQALGHLKEQGFVNFEYQLVGGGDQTYLRSIAEKYNVTDQVKFLGSIPHNEVFDWLGNIDIYVQPSRQEGLPRALIEAMSKGLPAFGARTAGIPELLESQFIFSNSRQNIDEICTILQSFTKNIMKEQAQRNYYESKKYERNIIEQRRRAFFEDFKSNS